MKWLWSNYTQIGFGLNAVKDHLPKFIKPHSKILCTFGGGSIDHNGARSDVTEVLSQLQCEVRWEGGIPANPEYDRLMEIVQVVKDWKPDLILSVGGGSILDGTKFICVAAKLEGGDAWETIFEKHTPLTEAYPIASVMTLPATGSEWNNGFVVSRRSQKKKLSSRYPATYPQFSLLDPRYTMTLPVRQLRNGVWDGITHCCDQFITNVEQPLTDSYWMSTIKELVTIGPDLVKENSSLELHERLIMAASFALNQVFICGKSPCWSIHSIGHQLTAKYGIDHAATLAIVLPNFYECQHQFEFRKNLMAKTAEFVFGVNSGTVDEKARAFIDHMKASIKAIGQPSKVSEWEGAVISPADVEEVTKMVMTSIGGQPFGAGGNVTEADVREILSKCIQ